MERPPSRRRRHAAGSARILTAGLSSAAAFGMVAGMAVTATGQEPGPPAAASLGTTANPAPVAVSVTTPNVIVVVRRHWTPAPSRPDTPPAPAAPTPTPLLVTATARPTPVAAPPARATTPRPAATPVTRTRGS